MRLVFDTNVLVAAMRSPSGASSRLLEAVAAGEITAVVSVSLFVEYEAVLTRHEHMAAAGVNRETVLHALSALISVADPVDIHFRLRPEAVDPDDDMVLETAVNGQADALVTFETRAFDEGAKRHGIRLVTPAQAWSMVRK